MRATLRRGENLPTQQKDGPQKGMLIAVPLFHVTGCTSFTVRLMAMFRYMLVLTAVPDDGHHDRHENSLDKEMGN